ncbi:hypothetical protein TPHV1_310006 [Treponema phagedenis]|uniref:Uncharacterized protein n=1 Tax=Treponema phagedenis TaxID=162 RepID=A0A0B7GXQ8_TREPH|nr:hypothetical protein TPHV1_310006 [Treponema phagedenis]
MSVAETVTPFSIKVLGPELTAEDGIDKQEVNKETTIRLEIYKNIFFIVQFSS